MSSMENILWAYHQTNISPIEKFVLVTMANHAGGSHIFPKSGIQLLRTECNLGTMKLRETLDALEKHGLVDVNEDGSLQLKIENGNGAQ